MKSNLDENDEAAEVMSSVSTVGSTPWLSELDGLPATQEQCQSSCSSGNGGCSPSKVAALPLREDNGYAKACAVQRLPRSR